MTTLILGAGMAGMAAAHALHHAQQAVIVLEARARLGGRLYTQMFGGIPVEFGAEFIHGTEAEIWPLVQQTGVATLHWRKTDDSLVRLADGSLKTMQQARAEHPDFDLTRSWDLPDVAVLAGDEPLDAYLRRLGLSEAQLHYAERSYANATAAPLSQISAQAALEDMSKLISGGDYRVLGGYSKLIEHLAQGIDVRLNAVVTRVIWGTDGVTAETAAGERYHGARAIITAPLGVLQSDAITFDPPLPAAKQTAIDGLGMGQGAKIIFHFASNPFPQGIGAWYSSQNPPMWWSPSIGRENNEGGGTVVTAFVTGAWWGALSADGEAAAVAAALSTLRAEIGDATLTPLAVHVMNWSSDEYARGAYSYTPPGAYALREQLAAPTAPLYWAGEATAPHVSASTVHGAYLSGVRAAREVLGG
jgi:monoamine oxidase